MVDRTARVVVAYQDAHVEIACFSRRPLGDRTEDERADVAVVRGQALDCAYTRKEPFRHIGPDHLSDAQFTRFGTARAPSRLADGEARKTLRLLVDDLDAGDGRSAGTLAAEAEERLHRFRLSLEDDLHRAVRPVPHPAGDATALRRPRDREPEPDALNEAVHDDPAAHHYTYRLWKSAGGCRRGPDSLTKAPERHDIAPVRVAA